MLYSRRFPLRLKGVVCMSYVRPALLYGSEAWCLRKNEMGILRRKKRSMVENNVWSAALRRKKIYRFDVHAGFEGNYGSVRYGKQCSLVWSCVEEKGWSHLKKGIRFEVDGQWKKGRSKRTWTKKVCMLV